MKEIRESKLDEFLEKISYYYDLPGISAAAGRASGIEYTRAFGVKSLETQEPLQPKDIFHMASLAKLFTGTAIMQLREKNLLNLDASIQTYLDWFSMADPRAEEITVRQLLSHTSGMPDVDNYHWDNPETDDNALKRYMQSREVRDSHLLWPPSERKFSYSNIGYDLLGLIAAEVSGISFENLIEKEIFQPLGMFDSTFLTFQRNMSEICAPHEKNQENQVEAVIHYPYNRTHGPSSTLTSNVFDIAKWAMAHLNQRVFSPETYNLVWSEFAEVPNNGEKICLSWFSREQGGYRLYGHEGADDGFRSSFWICPELDFFIILTSNLSGAPLKKISKQIFDIFLLNNG